MYESFGAYVPASPGPNGKTTVEFRVFFPSASAYVAAGQPRIKQISVHGSFQSPPWDKTTAIVLKAGSYPPPPSPGPAVGTLFSASVALPDGYYEYKYLVEFDDGQKRTLSDPCARYGGAQDDNSAFVIGGLWPAVKKMARRLPLRDLVIYELMIDDFAAGLVTAGEAPLEAVKRKVAYIKTELGANAIAFLPWTAWPGGGFSWGYNPAFFFSVESRYMKSPGRALDKLALLRELINECHEQGVQVIMDGVFNHAQSSEDSGFPYACLYENSFESPFIGTFSGGGFFTNLDFNNECTHDFIFDVCRYWIEEFGIDGIRFDYTLGFWHGDDRGHGLNRLIFDLKQYLRNQKETDFLLILEHLTDNRYEAVNAVNQVGSSACWFDPPMHVAWRYLDRHRKTDGRGEIVDLEVLRTLDAGRDFDPGRGAIAYIENHDHSRICSHAGGRAFWWRTQPYAIALFTGTGTPMIYNGQELAEDQWMPESGNGRVMARPIDWTHRTDAIGTQVFDLYQKLIAIRLAHPALRGPNIAPAGQEDWARDLDPKGFGVSRNLNVVVFHRWGPNPKKPGEVRYVVVLNFGADTRRVHLELPRVGTWTDLLSGWTLTIGGDQFYDLDVGGNWGHVFYWE
jgi:pullulanase